MQYPYPDEFSRKSRGRVLGESLRAAREFDTAKREARNSSEIERLLRKYILRGFIVFVREARLLGSQGLWTTDRLESEALEFLRQFSVEAYYEKGYDHSGGRLGEMISNWSGSIRPEIQRAFEQSPEWQEFQDVLMEVADAQASREEEGTQLDAGISRPSVTRNQQYNWEDVTITFLSDERVQVNVGGEMQTRNYAEMGFVDRRSGKPNQAWGLLRTLAGSHGVIPLSARNSIEFIAMGKRIERMRKILIQCLGISSDPIPLDSDKSYRCRFQIGRAPSFET